MILRRRLDTTNNGIFIFRIPEKLPGEDKYYRRQRNKHSSPTSVGILLILVLFLVLNNTPISPKIQNALVDANVRITSIVEDKNDSVPHTLQRASAFRAELPRIPRRLIFTHKYNLVHPDTNDPPFNKMDPLTANVIHTIEQYEKYWNDTDMRGKELGGEVVVSFLSDNDCLKVIEKAEPRLVQHFLHEKRGDYKADICRVAELYLYGGYYFDTDIQVVTPIDFSGLYLPSEIPDPIWHLRAIRQAKKIMPRKDDIVTFSVVYDRQGQQFPAFIASMPRHPVLKRTLDCIVACYEGSFEQIPPFIAYSIEAKVNLFPSRKKNTEMGLGSFALSIAHRLSTNKEWEEYARDLMNDYSYGRSLKSESRNIPAKMRYSRHLYEVSLEDEDIVKLGLFSDYPLRDTEHKGDVKSCNQICFHGHRVFFYSNMAGSKGCYLKNETD